MWCGKGKNMLCFYHMENQKRSGVLKWALIISIVIVINLFVNYALSLVWEAPQYGDFCDRAQTAQTIETESQCVAAEGEWNAYAGKLAPEEPSGYCDLYAECNERYEDARADYERNVFMILIGVGVVLFILSLVVKSNYVVSVALALAAVLDYVVASMRYWSAAENITRVLILGIALIALIYLAYKKFGE